VRYSIPITVLVTLAGSSICPASPVIAVGDHTLNPNQAHQPIDIFVSGGDAVQGINLFAQTEQNGILGGPVLEQIDLLSGTIFSPNNTGATDLDGAPPDSSPHWEGWFTTTLTGTIAAEGLLGRIYLDTRSGCAPGESYDLILSDTLNGSTNFAGIPAEITDGTIVISSSGPGPAVIPEPATCTLLGIALWGLACQYRTWPRQRVGKH